MTAGRAANVIPSGAELKLTVRARRPEVRAFLRDRIIAMARAQAAVHGATASVDSQWKSPPCINDPDATDFARRVAVETMGAGAPVPGCYFIVGNGKPGEGPGCMVHNTGYDVNDALPPTTASYWVSLVLAYLR